MNISAHISRVFLVLLAISLLTFGLVGCDDDDNQLAATGLDPRAGTGAQILGLDSQRLQKLA